MLSDTKLCCECKNNTFSTFQYFPLSPSTSLLLDPVGVCIQIHQVFVPVELHYSDVNVGVDGGGGMERHGEKRIGIFICVPA